MSSNDPSSWTELAEELKSVSLPYFKKHNDWYEANGLPRNPNQCQRIYPSPYLNIYHYPLEIDYTDLRPNPPNWLRMDTFMIKPNQEFVIPDKLKKLPGKLIYFSLGSVNSKNVDLMKKLVNYLSSSPHRFIVSKGMFGEEYDLPDNCWGDNVIPQTEVLKVVDLAIIHGGNNSLCEAFYFGKPMIIMPLFGDQNDNAQRVKDKGFGLRLNPFCCTKEELLGAIEQLVNDENLKKRMKLIAERCERESKTNKAVEIVEDVVKRAKQK